MSKHTNHWKHGITAALLAAFSLPALADRPDSVRYADELESCVTAIKAEIDLAGVNRIRHIVTKSNAQGLAYELKLETSTYAGNMKKNYAAYCLVTGKGKPSRLRVEEVSS